VEWSTLPASAWGSVIFSAVFGLCLGNFLGYSVLKVERTVSLRPDPGEVLGLYWCYD
jgi:hypothetical protein